MSPVTHFLTGWAIANVARLERRDRALVTLAAVIPDVDGIGFIPELLTRRSSHPMLWFSQHHHALHTLLFALVVAALSLSLARRRWVTTALVFSAFHVHLLEDLAGSRGPDGYGWPIPYLQPFSDWSWTWSGQWGLNAWPNATMTCVLVVVTIWVAVKKGRTPVEFVSRAADEVVVRAVRGWVADRS